MRERESDAGEAALVVELEGESADARADAGCPTPTGAELSPEEAEGARRSAAPSDATDLMVPGKKQLLR